MNMQRKIAIITDAHGLYEPTLSILEDIKKRNIKEIYSLGDNIGFGPNPKEVMDLLEKYNVKSIRGNHEEYILDIEKYKEHLIKKDAYLQTIEETSILKNKLTKNYLESIKKMPKSIELNINNKKILLCHYTKSYNKDLSIIKNTDKYEIIIEGHRHKSISSGNILTLRALAFNHSNTYCKASYLIIEQTTKDYNLDEILVDYDQDKLRQSIESSELNQYQKTKMLKWTGQFK